MQKLQERVGGSSLSGIFCTQHQGSDGKGLEKEKGKNGMLLIAVVDDDKQEMDDLVNFVEHYFQSRQEEYIIYRYHDGVEFIRSRELYNIVFLDIRLGEMDGLDVARFLRMVNKEAQLIFVTHMAQFAIRGYEVDAMDFIIKPIDQFSIDRVLDKAIKRINDYRNITLALKTSNGIVSITSNSIFYVEVYDHDLIYHTEQGDYKVRGQLGEVRKKLEGHHFIQCNRSYLVNMRHVKRLQSDYLEVNGVRIQISKSHQKEIEQRFINYLGKRL